MEMLLAVVAGRAPSGLGCRVVSGQGHFPEDMADETYYRPTDRGFEREIGKWLAYWDRLRRERGKGQ